MHICNTYEQNIQWIKGKTDTQTQPDARTLTDIHHKRRATYSTKVPDGNGAGLSPNNQSPTVMQQLNRSNVIVTLLQLQQSSNNFLEHNTMKTKRIWHLNAGTTEQERTSFSWIYCIQQCLLIPQLCFKGVPEYTTALPYFYSYITAYSGRRSVTSDSSEADDQSSSSTSQ